MIRSTPTSRSLALLLLAAATVSSGVLAAPTTSSRSSALHSTGVEGLQFRSSPSEQGSLLDVQRQGVEPYVNLVPRTDTLGLRDARTRTTGTVAMGNLCMIFDSWLNTSHDEQNRLVLQVHEDHSFLLQLGSAGNSPQSVFESNKSRLEEILKTAEKAIAAAIPGNLFITAIENHENSLKFFPESDEKSAAKRRYDCALEKNHKLVGTLDGYFKKLTTTLPIYPAFTPAPDTNYYLLWKRCSAMPCMPRNVLLVQSLAFLKFEPRTGYLQKEGVTTRPPNWRTSWTLDLVAQMEKVAWHIVLFSPSTVLIYTISPYSSPGLAPPSLLQVPLCLPAPLPLPLLYSFTFISEYAWPSPLLPKCCINNGLRYSEGNATVSWLLLFDSAPPPPPPPQHYKRWLDKIWQQYVPHQHQQQPSSSSSSSPLTVTLEKTYIDHSARPTRG
ncbi:hypothetical protein EV360DRAFT_88674 [Lentinula raphanica]|nr:hypothetical protein EV360DRAFT_88674 [Lentinula raphanica]